MTLVPVNPASDDTLLEIDGLRTYFRTDDGLAKAVDGVSYGVPRGKTVAVVGESGCGKSVTALSILRLIPQPPGRIAGGRILFDGTDLLTLSEEEIRRIRGKEIAMIFQEPMTSLNPVFTVGYQVTEAILAHEDASKKEARNRTVELFRKVRIPEAERRVDEYPHQLSGGMKQRVMIAMGLACNPKLLIADEPTTALDVTIQAQILELLAELQQQQHMSILFITHDLGVVAEIADEVVVMYASKVVERAPVKELFANPLHPYTIGLFESKPSLVRERGGRLPVIPGTVPNPTNFPSGCKFHPRCPKVFEPCNANEPELLEVRPGHWAACHLHDPSHTPAGGSA